MWISIGLPTSQLDCMVFILFSLRIFFLHLAIIILLLIMHSSSPINWAFTLSSCSMYCKCYESDTVFSISHQAFVCLLCSEIISGETDNGNAENQWKSSILEAIFSLSVFTAWHHGGWSRTFPALGITKSVSFHNIWDALTLMLDLIILPVRHRYNTFIRIY